MRCVHTARAVCGVTRVEAIPLLVTCFILRAQMVSWICYKAVQHWTAPPPRSGSLGVTRLRGCVQMDETVAPDRRGHDFGHTHGGRTSPHPDTKLYRKRAYCTAHALTARCTITLSVACSEPVPVQTTEQSSQTYIPHTHSTLTHTLVSGFQPLRSAHECLCVARQSVI